MNRTSTENWAWFKKGSGTVVRSTLRAVPATVPDPFSNYAENCGLRTARYGLNCRPERSSPCRTRRAMATLVVLLLISVTLAMSYSIMRSQGTAVAIQANANLTAEARQAAITGLTLGLKTMHDGDWAGVDSPVSGSLGSYQGYQVTYTTGDDSLGEDDPDYEEYPYRVTLLSTGWAADPGDASRTATHRAKAVVRLVPRKLSDEPEDLDEIRRHTVYQSGMGVFKVNVPFRIEGPVRIQKTLDLAKVGFFEPWYAWPEAARVRYLTDLEAMRQASLGDFRPFTGTLSLPYNLQQAGLIDLLNTSMDVSTNNVASDSIDDWDYPSQIPTYRIYPGGKTYSAKLLGSTLRYVELKPEVETNPLGIYYRDGAVSIQDNVKIEGTILTPGSGGRDLYVRGYNIHLQPHDLPPLYGSEAAVQLPTAVIGDDLIIYPESYASIAGLMVMGDDIEIKEDAQEGPATYFVGASHSGWRLDEFLRATMSNYFPEQIDRLIRAGCVELNGAPAGPEHVLQSGQRVRVLRRVMIGTIVAKDVKIDGREDWFMSSSTWSGLYDDFLDQVEEEDGTAFFPLWLGDEEGLTTVPDYGIRPDPNNVHYHWQNQNDPIYVPHPDDASPLDPDNPGLRWDLLEWTDNP